MGNGTGDIRPQLRNLAQTPEFRQFLSDNPWYDVNNPSFDAVAHGAATALSAEIGSNPETKGSGLRRQARACCRANKSSPRYRGAPEERELEGRGLTRRREWEWWRRWLS